MSSATLTMNEPGILSFAGVLDFNSVPALWDECSKKLASDVVQKIDLSQVERTDSSGVALLIACVREAEQQGRSVEFLNMSEQMQHIARVSELEDVLGI